MIILAIDPGPTESAYVLWNGTQLVKAAKRTNEELLALILKANELRPRVIDACVIEKIASYGMAVGAEVFETVYWSGRFAQAFGDPLYRIPRLTVKMHLCHDSKAKDSNIRQALIDRFGGKDQAIGKKANPGPLYGVAGDAWQALALAIAWHESQERTAA